MPKFLENDLRRAGRKKGFSGEKLEHYVYGGMNNLGAMHGSEETAKGREMEEKHEEDMKSPAGHVREMRIEVHRGPKNEVTGHTVHHHMMPSKSKNSPSGAFMENREHSYPFDGEGNSAQHGHMLDHIGEHLGILAAATKGAAQEEEEEPGEA